MVAFPRMLTSLFGSSRSLLALACAAAVALPASTAFARDSGYHTVEWVQVRSDGGIGFKLDDGTYYVCSDAKMRASCSSTLLTALAAEREVKAYYRSGTCTSSSSCVVTTLRIR